MKTRKHTFVFDSHNNGGEQFLVCTTIHQHTGEPPFTTHEFNLQSYGNSTSIYFGEQITPSILRQWANELDEILAKMKEDCDE